MDVPPDLRANVDYVVVLRDNIRSNRERIYKYFAGMFPTFAAFDEVMQQCTQDHEAMVLDLGCLSYKLSDSVFFYKATPGLRYRLCAPEYWEFSKKQVMHKEERDEDCSSDEDEARVKPKEQIRVKKRYPKAKQRPGYKENYRDLLRR